jgi:ABC-type multidrug transport system fused ATPase/permease subunit
MRGLRDLAQGRTILLITHRLSTVTHADRILLLKNGRLIEDGTPADLRAAESDGGRAVDA